MAFSGGRDSTALLHATVTCASRLGLEVVALHVNHRLSPDAARWQSRAAALCRRWARAGAPLGWAACRLAGSPPPGASVEAWARQARYRALAEMARARGIGLVLLAHHRADQAETFLLQALRGAGPVGLAAMPRTVCRAGIVWSRPWLDVPRPAIEAYLGRHRLRWIDDPSNAEPRFARNRLRRAVMPAFGSAFPDAEASLAQTAVRMQEAAEALAELAGIDVAASSAGDALQLQAWLALSPARRSNALRHWLRRELGRGAPAALIERLLAEWPRARGWREWPCEGNRLVAWAGLLRLERCGPAPAEPPEPVELCVRGAGLHSVGGWPGRLEVTEASGGGVPWPALERLRACPRQGGEQFQVAAGRPARSLKKQFQAASIAPEDRGGPLIYSGDRLLFVPGLGVDARALAPPGTPQAALRWIAGASASLP